jgi:hypothetical protein
MAPTACPHKAWFNEPYSVRITGRGAALLNIAHKCGIFSRRFTFSFLSLLLQLWTLEKGNEKTSWSIFKASKSYPKSMRAPAQ